MLVYTSRMGTDSERGLTLIEMLIVLAIVGVMAGAVVLSMRGGGGGGAEAEAVRLAARLRLAADDVRLDDRSLAFAWDETGYGFVDWDAARRRWVADPVDGLRRYDLPKRLALAVPGGRSPTPIGADGLGPPITARIGDGKDAWEVRFDGLDAQASRIAAR